MSNNSIIKKLFTRRDNLLSLVTILISSTIAFLSFFTSYLTLGVLLAAILVVLTLIAVTSIIEREARFEGADHKPELLIQQIERIRGPIFWNIKEIPSLRDYVSGANELFDTGGHLNALVLTNTNLFEEWLRAGKSLKFILQNPENEGGQLMWAFSCRQK